MSGPTHEPPGSGMDPIETAEVSCPCCGASVQMLLDPTGGLDQEYVEDCEVCCRPWQVHVTYRESVPHVDLRTLDET